jgi:hypothetical protein
VTGLPILWQSRPCWRRSICCGGCANGPERFAVSLWRAFD